MLAHLVVALLQLPAVPPATPHDTTSARDSTGQSRDRRHEPRRYLRDSVTAEHLATAYGSPSAREILALARRARNAQDSSLQSYDATTYQRISAGFALSRLMRDRLAFRTEAATRVRWRRGVGAYVDVTGSRTVVPIAGRSASADVGGNISPIPYYPGSETILLGVSAARMDSAVGMPIIHPLAAGAEAYYRYEAGDSMEFRLPDGTRVQLRELRVRPRSPRWNLAVGSLWFDMRGGQLVRAAYRLAAPMDIAAVAREDDPHAFDDVPTLVKPMIFPMTAEVSAVGVEYGLFQGRFWLPRMQVIEGGAQIGPMRSPFKIEQRYDYAAVNAGDPLPPIPAPSDSARRRSGGGSVTIDVGSSGAERDSMRAMHRGRNRARCDSTGTRSYTRRSGDSTNRVFIRIPCDSAKLANSPDLPPSIYDRGDEAMDGSEMQALLDQALSMGAQAAFAPQLPVFTAESPRYNRVEGLSFGGRVDQQLGAGYSLGAMGRIGLADREPLAELTASRSDMRRTVAFTVYNRLVSASDYGTPFSLGSSISALLFARDEGYYYRASGVELTSSPDQPQGAMWSWGLFAEQERSAPRRTTFALARGATGFAFDTNLVVNRATFIGARTRLLGALGQDPEGARLSSDLRLEAARGDSGGYGRAALDLTVSHPVGGGSAALTLAGGTSVGSLPVQRDWFLGGAQTVRGESGALEPGRMGNAFWLARAEVARGFQIARPVAFVDVGWAGDRTRWREVGRPVSGAGVGLSVMDGLLRFDLARGISPDKNWRLYTYVEGRF